MSYTALYRKFRPDNFKDVKGQDHIVTTLKNQIAAERVGHAYLFCGTRGTGKTSIAKLFDKTVNCENPMDGNPCGECPSCRAIAAGASMNVMEIDAASNNGVENIRDIISDVSYSPAEGRYKVYIIDEVHMLSIGAFNALLKTLEEPPSYCIFILATTEVHKIPITILSRCQRYDFKRITIDTITDRLKELMEAEQVEAEEKALRYVAKTADGSMRDALSLLDQCIAFHFGQKLTYDMVLDVLGAVDTVVFSKLLRQILDRNVIGCIDLLEEIVMQGRELAQFVSDFTWYLRNLLLVKTTEDVEDLLDVSTDNKKRLMEEAEMTDAESIIRFIRIFSELSGTIRYSAQKRIVIEIALIKLCKPEMETKSDALVDRIRALEEKIEKGVPMAVMPGGGYAAVGADGEVANTQAAPVKRELPKALPEEIKDIVSKWPAIVNTAENLLKNQLKHAKLSLSTDDKLLLIVEDGISSDYFAIEGKKQEVEKLISEFMQRQVEITIQSISPNRDFSDEYVDLSQFIMTDIEVDDNFDEEP